MEENVGYGQVCGVSPLTVGAGKEAAADIPMEENVGYGVTNQVCGVSPLTVGAGREAAADIPMNENVGYGITNQACGVSSLSTRQEAAADIMHHGGECGLWSDQ